MQSHHQLQEVLRSMGEQLTKAGNMLVSSAVPKAPAAILQDEA